MDNKETRPRLHGCYMQESLEPNQHKAADSREPHSLSSSKVHTLWTTIMHAAPASAVQLYCRRNICSCYFKYKRMPATGVPVWDP